MTEIILYGSSLFRCSHPVVKAAALRDNMMPTVAGRHMRVIGGPGFAWSTAAGSDELGRGYWGRYYRDQIDAFPSRVDPRMQRRLDVENQRLIDYLERHAKYNPKQIPTSADADCRIKRTCKGILEFYTARDAPDRHVYFLLDGLDIDRIARKQEPFEFRFPGSELRKIYRLHCEAPELIDERVTFVAGDRELKPSQVFEQKPWDAYQPRHVANPNAADVNRLRALLANMQGGVSVARAFSDAAAIQCEATRSAALVAIADRLQPSAVEIDRHAQTIGDPLIRDLTYKDIGYICFDRGRVEDAIACVDQMRTPHLRREACTQMCHHFVVGLSEKDLNGCAAVLRWIERSFEESTGRDLAVDLRAAMDRVRTRIDRGSRPSAGHGARAGWLGRLVSKIMGRRMG